MTKNIAIVGLGACMMIAIGVLAGRSVSADVKTTSQESASTRNATTTTAPTTQVSLKTFNFQLQKGQFIFIGNRMGTKGKDEWDQDIWPAGKVQIDPKALSQWDMQLSVEQGTDKDGKTVWNWEATWERKEPRRVSGQVQSSSRKWQVRIPDDKKVEPVESEMTDISKDMSVDGLTAFKIPYTKIDGETYYVLVAIGDKKEVFPKKIAIAKSFILFSWDNWSTLK